MSIATTETKTAATAGTLTVAHIELVQALKSLNRL